MYYEKDKTIVIVLTEKAWLSILDGKIIDERDLSLGSPIDQFQSYGPEYVILEASKPCKYEDAVERVRITLEKQTEPKKEATPEDETKSKSKTMSRSSNKRKRRQQEAMLNRERNLIAKKRAKEEAKVQEPVQPEPVQQEVIAPGPMQKVRANTNTKIKETMKTIDLNKRKAVTQTKKGLGRAIDVATNCTAIPLWMAGDLANWLGSTAMSKLGVYEESRDEIMQRRREYCIELEDKLLEAPSKIADYTKAKYEQAAKFRTEKTVTEAKSA